MSAAYSIKDQRKVYFLTFTIIDWCEVFRTESSKIILIDSLKYCQEKKGLEVFAYCIMINHIHLVARAAGEPDLSSIVRDFKKYTSKKIISMLKEEGNLSSRIYIERFRKAASNNPKHVKYCVWQRGSHPIELSSNKFIDEKIEYIHSNPVKAGLVFKEIDYPYSSASNYSRNEGLLNVVVTYGRWKTY